MVNLDLVVEYCPVVDHGEKTINSMAKQVMVSKKKQITKVLTL